jgi:hypothetical protein
LFDWLANCSALCSFFSLSYLDLLL